MPKELDAPDDDDRLVVAVVRSGGVAGISRRWTVAPPRPEIDVWVGLIERCPWDAPQHKDRGADRYVWSIQARMPQQVRERELADSELQGAWRELVEAVREADSPSPSPTPAPSPIPPREDPASPE
ncbi:hypothetical protein KEC56_03640 [Microbacterium sp. YMB-B2]|uniref:Uncharacterized protein n=1 Tax=Microbacterium tenebrionis TaxID=2830665 RepID=A0A9X1LMS7_9MICO|nr:protealysin inhibitor emfourin [Microbacterium tenebrionis]MCC2028624.1 hypothetical protein [Microbacterium tenebrionis]